MEEKKDRYSAPRRFWHQHLHIHHHHRLLHHLPHHFPITPSFSQSLRQPPTPPAASPILTILLNFYFHPVGVKAKLIQPFHNGLANRFSTLSLKHFWHLAKLWCSPSNGPPCRFSVNIILDNKFQFFLMTMAKLRLTS